MREQAYIGIKDLFGYISQLFLFGLSRWKVLMLAGIAGGGLGFLIATFSKPVYHAKLSFLLNENEGGGSLNISSLASLAGISGLGGNGNVSEDKLIFLTSSRSLNGTTLLVTEKIDGREDILANHFIEIYKMRSSFSSDTCLKNFDRFVHSKLSQLDYRENKALDFIINYIDKQKLFTIEVKKKTGLVAQWAGIIILTFKSLNEEFSKVYVEQLYQNLSSYYTNKTIKKQLQNYQLIRQRADSIAGLLYSKEEAGAELYDRNLKMVRMKGLVDIQRSRRETEMLSLMYGEILKNMEIAKFALDNQTPVFQIVDNPSFPLEKKKMSRLYTAIIASIITGFIVFIGLVMRNNETLKPFKENKPATDNG